MYFLTYPSWWMTRQRKWLTPSSPLSFYLQDVQLFINLLLLNFPFHLFEASVVKLCRIFLSSASAAADCTQDGDPEIILCNIWLQMWGCNLQIPSPKKAGQWLPCLAFMGGESGGMGKIMRGFRHACGVTVSARQKKAGLMRVWTCTKKIEISVSAPLPKYLHQMSVLANVLFFRVAVLSQLVALLWQPQYSRGLSFFPTVGWRKTGGKNR